MSYGMLRPVTARFAPIEWLLHVRLLAHWAPFGSKTPHCFSTSTGCFGLGTLDLGSSFFFFFAFGPLSASASAFRFFPFFAPDWSAFAFTALFRAPFPFSPASSSSPFSFRAAASLASLASFFLCCFSCFFFKQSRICAGAKSLATGFLQCLHWTMSGVSSRGRPFGKAASVRSSGVLTRGDVGRFTSVFFVADSISKM